MLKESTGMGNTPSIRARVLNHNGILIPGQANPIKLILNTSGEKWVYKTPRFRLLVTEQMSWTRVHLTPDLKRTYEERYFKNHTHFTSPRQIWYQNLPVPFSLEPNKEIESPSFDITIPNSISLPPSYKYDKYNFIRYTIHMTLPLEHWYGFYDHEFTSHVIGRCSVDERLLSLKQNHEIDQYEHKSFILSGNKPFMVRAHLQDSVWISGQQYNIDLNVFNPDRVPYHSINIGVIQKHMDEERNNETHVQDEISLSYQELNQRGMLITHTQTEGENDNLIYERSLFRDIGDYLRSNYLTDQRYFSYDQIRIPITLSNNLVSTFQGKFFNNSYHLRITFRFSMFHTCQVKVPLKVISDIGLNNNIS